MHLVKAAAGGPVGLLLVHLSISPSRLTKLSQLVELFESPSLRNRPISRITQHQRAVFVSLKKKRKKEEEKNTSSRNPSLIDSLDFSPVSTRTVTVRTHIGFSRLDICISYTKTSLPVDGLCVHAYNGRA